MEVSKISFACVDVVYPMTQFPPTTHMTMFCDHTLFLLSHSFVCSPSSLLVTQPENTHSASRPTHLPFLSLSTLPQTLSLGTPSDPPPRRTLVSSPFPTSVRGLSHPSHPASRFTSGSMAGGPSGHISQFLVGPP